MEKIYQCICGKTFDNPQKFNGHKSNCKIHKQNKGTYEARIQQRAEIAQKVRNDAKEKRELRKSDLLDKWISEQHKCEKCGIIMTEKFGSGRFCSRKCSNGHPHSQESKVKAYESLMKTLSSRKPTFKSKGYHKTDISAEIKEQRKLERKKLRENQRLKKQQEKKQLFEVAYKELIEENDRILNKYISKLNTAVELIDTTNLHKVSGYYVTRVPDHLRVFNDQNYVFVHVLIAEKMLNRKLNSEELVHHLDSNRINNSPTNLVVFDNIKSHGKFHHAKYFKLSIVGDVLHCDRLIYRNNNFQVID